MKTQLSSVCKHHTWFMGVCSICSLTQREHKEQQTAKRKILNRQRPSRAKKNL